MSIKDWFLGKDNGNKSQTKQQESPVILKSYPNNQYSFYDYLNLNGEYDLSIIVLISLYLRVSPFFLCVDKIARAIAQISFKVKDKNTEDFVDHPVLELLNNPNAEQSGSQFIYELSSVFSITGNAFINSTGRVTQPPLEIWNVKPQWVTAFNSKIIDNLGQMPSRYQVSTRFRTSVMFDADEIKDGMFSTVRYYNDTTGELWHIKQYNPFGNVNNYFGSSKAQPLVLELEQYASGNVNNLNLLKRGSRPSMAWVNNRGEELTENQWQRLQDEAAKYSGSANAGSTPILDGMDVKEMSQNNRDMQFKELQDATRASIANVYGIPLALISDAVMTFNNLETSQTQFYENAVVPQMDYLTDELTRLLMYRYEGSENLEITY
jgi:HK97 family phage portal protein